MVIGINKAIRAVGTITNKFAVGKATLYIPTSEADLKNPNIKTSTHFTIKVKKPIKIKGNENKNNFLVINIGTSLVLRKGKTFFEKLNKLKDKYSDRIAYIFGNGLVAAPIFKKPESLEPDMLFPSKVSERAMQKGLLVVHTGRESIKLAPPLTIPDDALAEGIDTLDQTIEEIISESN